MLTSLRDIIDCERFIIGGDVFKMLAGSFIPELDGEDIGDGSLILPNSPDPRQIGPELTFTATQATDDGVSHGLPLPTSPAELGFHPISGFENGR